MNQLFILFLLLSPFHFEKDIAKMEG